MSVFHLEVQSIYFHMTWLEILNLQKLPYLHGFTSVRVIGKACKYDREGDTTLFSF